MGKAYSQHAHDALYHPFHRVHVDDPQAAELLSLCLRWHLYQRRRNGYGLNIVCVGTDRSTGDAFGPLVGSRLRAANLEGVEVFGTLDEPVHATNLHLVLDELASRPQPSLTIAVDACLGRAENVGVISVRDAPLQPGTGVHKRLPPVGDLHVVGIVNVGGCMEYFVLQSTRLSLVVRMAELTATAICQAIAWDAGRGEPPILATPAPTRE